MNKNKRVRRNVSHPRKKWWEKWQTRLAFVIVVLTVLTTFLELPKKVSEFWKEISGTHTVTTPLKGIVTDSFTNKPINSAVVKIDRLPGDSVITTSDGSFKFKSVPGKVGDDVRIYVYAKGYNSRNEYKVLPGPVDIKLGKSK